MQVLTKKPDITPALARHIVRYGPKGSAGWVLDFAQEKYTLKTLLSHGNTIKAVVQGAQERGIPLTDAEKDKASVVVGRLLVSPGNEAQLGVELVGTLKLTGFGNVLLAIFSQTSTPEPLRKSCVTTMVALDPKQAVPTLVGPLLGDGEKIAIREHIAAVLAGTNRPDAHAALVQALQKAPARLQSTIALGMASSAQGGDRLLQAIEAGKASPRLLQDRAIELRLQNAKIANVKDRLKKLTQGLPAADQKTQALIGKRRDAFASFKSDAIVGQKIFQKHCAACHQIANQGAKVGPNLDGIGARGLERLLEDVLDPNRNVDQAFRATVITTKAGQTFSGLFLREEGNVVILADKDGKDVRIEKGQIDERAISPLSPMPSNFSEALSEPELHHLMAYLLEQRAQS